MSKKVGYATNVRKLLSTGILEGATVKYISFAREKELLGVIQGGGYLCGCPLYDLCRFVMPEFEQHAGCRTKHLNILMITFSWKMGSQFMQFIGSLLCGCGRRVCHESFSGCGKGDNDLHQLSFLPNGLPDGADLAYYSKGQRLLEGYKQGNGIVCSCCNNEISPSQFEAHAGWATRRQLYRHIYTSSEFSLHDVSMSLANGQNLLLVTVMIYVQYVEMGGGGELMLCDGCPQPFIQLVWNYSVYQKVTGIVHIRRLHTVPVATS
uniref:Tify domain-containing protein n=1 Tax=Nelumbo nucifera TaxID=4432 RepID=A0A822Y1P0_NELNU|nr:TPA_asm: hypothetical protein HUJ06_027361 [Nelumbo nucifera]